MLLKSTAQSISDTPFIIIDEDYKNSQPEISVEPEYILVEDPSQELSVQESEESEGLEVGDGEPIEVVLEFSGDLPGSPHSPEPVVKEKKDEDNLEVMEVVDENDAKKSKKSERWDWEAKGADGFVIWVKERFDTVPKHSGYDTAGLERAVSYLQKLDAEISKAMRLDLDEELDSNKVEEIRSKIEDGIDLLLDRLDKIKSSKVFISWLHYLLQELLEFV
jgi:hypothetical protein